VLKRKYMIIAFLTFCLIATFFMGVKTTTTSTTEYDPWADIDGDGDIDIFDLRKVAKVYGGTGDPTRNVNVTNFPTQQPEPSWKVINIVENLNVTWNTTSEGALSELHFYLTSVAGYSRMVIYATATNWTDIGNRSNSARIHLDCAWVWDYASTDTIEFYFIKNETSLHFTNGMPIETAAPTLEIAFWGVSNTTYTPRPSSISCLVSIGIYLRNE